MGEKRNGKRSYSDRERAEALAVVEACEGNVNLAAKQTGIPETTLWQWVTGRSRSTGEPIRQITENPDLAEGSDLRAASKKNLADMMEKVAYLYAERAANGQAVETTSGYYAVQAVQKCAETFQLLRGQPTAINENRNNAEAIAEQAKRLAEEWGRPVAEVQEMLERKAKESGWLS